MDYAEHPSYIRLTAAIIALDAATAIPFARLRQQGRAKRFVALRLLSVAVNLALTVFFYSGTPRLGKPRSGRRYVRPGIRRRLRTGGQPIGQRGRMDRPVSQLSRRTAAHTAQAVARGHALFAAPAYQRDRRNGQRVHRPADDQVSAAARELDGCARYLRSRRETGRRADAVHADVPLRGPSRTSCRPSGRKTSAGAMPRRSSTSSSCPSASS